MSLQPQMTCHIGVANFQNDQRKLEEGYDIIATLVAGTVIMARHGFAIRGTFLPFG